MDELHYVYALTHAGCQAADLGPGVDPRYNVELVPSGRIAAAASVVGLDEFDLSKIEEGTADVAWLGRVALRHNAIVQRLADSAPVLPLCLATLFRTRSSLAESLTQREADVAAFLDALGGRREWAVKIYLDRQVPSPRAATRGLSPADSDDAGRKYLADRREELNRAAQLRTRVAGEVLVAESRLNRLAPQWRRLRPLSAELTARPLSMVWNAAFLVSKTEEEPLRAACEQLRGDLGPKGLLLELTGPWPVYHFCEDLGLGARG